MIFRISGIYARTTRSFGFGQLQRRQQRLISSGTRFQVRMKPSDVKYEYVEEVERIDYYVPGGYHPVMIGDKFCEGRYIIAHKLGFGRSATTWLAEDRRNDRLVALKISTAESTDRTHEIQILSRLGDVDARLFGKTTVQRLYDTFNE